MGLGIKTKLIYELQHLFGVHDRKFEGHYLIIHMGVLYHLREPFSSLQQCCPRCRHLILETEVCDSDDPSLCVSVGEPRHFHDQALDGRGCRPSPALVEKVLTDERMQFERITDDRCNANGHIYDWPIRNTKSWRAGLRRMWFAERI